MFTALGEATSWANPELVAIGAAKINRFIAADPGLKKFAFGLRDVLRTASHTLSPEEEKLLASAGTPLGRAAGHPRPARRHPTFRGRR